MISQIIKEALNLSPASPLHYNILYHTEVCMWESPIGPVKVMDCELDGTPLYTPGMILFVAYNYGCIATCKVAEAMMTDVSFINGFVVHQLNIILELENAKQKELWKQMGLE